VVNARFVKPLYPESLLPLMSEHEYVVTLEAGTVEGGFGSAVLDFANNNKISKISNIIKIGFPDSFIQHGDKELLYQDIGLSPDQIAEKIFTGINAQLF
jgi:1-deoxy-D-xylulose-5-phosphate synthase